MTDKITPINDSLFRLPQPNSEYLQPDASELPVNTPVREGAFLADTEDSGLAEIAQSAYVEAMSAPGREAEVADSLAAVHNTYEAEAFAPAAPHEAAPQPLSPAEYTHQATQTAAQLTNVLADMQDGALESFQLEAANAGQEAAQYRRSDLELIA